VERGRRRQARPEICKDGASWLHPAPPLQWLPGSWPFGAFAAWRFRFPCSAKAPFGRPLPTAVGHPTLGAGGGETGPAVAIPAEPNKESVGVLIINIVI